MKIRISVLLPFLLSILLFPVPVYAQDGSGGSNPEETLTFELPSEDAETVTIDEVEPVKTLSVWNFVSMVLVLAGVVASIYGIFYLLKKTSGGRFAEDENIRIVSTKSLGGTRNLHVVETGGKYLLIAVTDTNITLLKEYHETDDKESVDQFRLVSSNQSSLQAGSFRDFFSRFVGPKRAAGDASAGHGTGEGAAIPDPDFMKQQRDRLKRL